MRQLARADAEGERAQAAMRAGVAVATNDQAAGETKTKLGADDMDDALTGLVDIENGDSARRRLGPQPFQQFQSGLAGAGAAMRGGNRVVRCREGQFGIVNGKIAALQVEQPAGTSEVVQ